MYIHMPFLSQMVVMIRCIAICTSCKQYSTGHFKTRIKCLSEIKSSLLPQCPL